MGISKLVRNGKIHRRKRICTGSRAFPGRFLRAFCCHRLSGALQGLPGLRSIPRLSGSPSRLSGLSLIHIFSLLVSSPVISMILSASVDLPWSIWAMMQKFLILL